MSGAILARFISARSLLQVRFPDGDRRGREALHTFEEMRPATEGGSATSANMTIHSK